MSFVSSSPQITHKGILMRSPWLKALTLTLTLLAVAVFSAGAQTLISTGAVWKYLDNGTDQGTAWRGTSFADGSWLSGPAQLGYGDGDEATTNSFGPDRKSVV